MPLSRRQLLTSSAAAPLLAAGGDSTAETRYGKVRGASSNGVTVFRGIPYGRVAERWMAPAAPEKWAGERDCTVTGPRCIQGAGNIFLSPTIGEYFRGSKDRAELAAQPDSEQCLVLNVLTPGVRGKRPVMVYIHGGGFTGGSSHITVFADRFPKEQDVVLVGVNHRLNVFGYLFLGDLDPAYGTGNAGQLDLIAALQWVRDNIANFGGDPANVTIFGESGGAAKISTLLAMPAAKGLFHKAILESGSVLRVGPREQQARAAKIVADRVGGLNKLRTLPAADLFKASLPRNGEVIKYIPVVDGQSVPSQVWEPAAPPSAAGVPMLIGVCKDERTLFSLKEEELFRLTEAELRARMKNDALVDAYRRAHPKESPTDIWFRYGTDREARWNSVKQAELQLAQNPAVYMYSFDWNTPLVDGKIKAFHTAELPLALRLVRFPESESMSKQIATAWASFARSGNPKWPRYDLKSRATMVFDAPVGKVVNDPGREARLLQQNNRPEGPL